MCTAADVKNDDGDKVSLGFCLLDIAKHAVNTFIASLEDDDYVAVVTYGSHAAVHMSWTKCDEAGRTTALERVNAMHISGSTNLVAGVETGFGQFTELPVPTEELPCYSQHLIVATDGQPDNRMDYAPLVAQQQEALVATRASLAARVNVTAIGLGNQSDSNPELEPTLATFAHKPFSQTSPPTLTPTLTPRPLPRPSPRPSPRTAPQPSPLPSPLARPPLPTLTDSHQATNSTRCCCAICRIPSCTCPTPAPSGPSWSTSSQL